MEGLKCHSIHEAATVAIVNNTINLPHIEKKEINLPHIELEPSLADDTAEHCAGVDADPHVHRLVTIFVEFSNR